MIKIYFLFLAVFFINSCKEKGVNSELSKDLAVAEKGQCQQLPEIIGSTPELISASELKLTDLDIVNKVYPPQNQESWSVLVNSPTAATVLLWQVCENSGNFCYPGKNQWNASFTNFEVPPIEAFSGKTAELRVTACTPLITANAIDKYNKIGQICPNTPELKAEWACGNVIRKTENFPVVKDSTLSDLLQKNDNLSQNLDLACDISKLANNADLNDAKEITKLALENVSVEGLMTSIFMSEEVSFDEPLNPPASLALTETESTESKDEACQTDLDFENFTSSFNGASLPGVSELIEEVGGVTRGLGLADSGKDGDGSNKDLAIFAMTVGSFALLGGGYFTYSAWKKGVEIRKEILKLRIKGMEVDELIRNYNKLTRKNKPLEVGPYRKALKVKLIQLQEEHINKAQELKKQKLTGEIEKIVETVSDDDIKKERIEEIVNSDIEKGKKIEIISKIVEGKVQNIEEIRRKITEIVELKSRAVLTNGEVDMSFYAVLDAEEGLKNFDRLSKINAALTTLDDVNLKTHKTHIISGRNLLPPEPSVKPSTVTSSVNVQSPNVKSNTSVNVQSTNVKSNTSVNVQSTTVKSNTSKFNTQAKGLAGLTTMLIGSALIGTSTQLLLSGPTYTPNQVIQHVGAAIALKLDAQRKTKNAIEQHTSITP